MHVREIWKRAVGEKGNDANSVEVMLIATRGKCLIEKIWENITKSHFLTRAPNALSKV